MGQKNLSHLRLTTFDLGKNLTQRHVNRVVLRWHSAEKNNYLDLNNIQLDKCKVTCKRWPVNSWNALVLGKHKPVIIRIIRFSACRVSLQKYKTVTELSLPSPDCSSSWRTFLQPSCNSQSLEVQLWSWELASSGHQRTHNAPQSIPWFYGFLPSAVYIQTVEKIFDKRNCCWYFMTSRDRKIPRNLPSECSHFNR